MMPQQPRGKTVKRLFALSSNRCAFPGCTAPLVDDSGVVTGEICHICAHRPDGPRHDADQSDEERHGFENLILMCGLHHKVIDEDLANYSVATLHAMKKSHESGPPRDEPSDSVVSGLLRNSGFAGDVTQVAADHGVNVAAAGQASVVIHAGLTYADARNVAMDVYRANALELSGAAADLAFKRVEKFVSDFLHRLQTRHAQPPESLADPDMQGAMFEAQKTAARAGDPAVCDVLVDLLVDRAGQPARDLLQIVLNEAVTTVGRLTPAHFDALTLVFILKYTRSFGVRDLNTLRGYLLAEVSPFLASAARSHASFQHMEYAGCGSIGLGSRDLATIFGGAYPHCFLEPIQEGEVAAALGTVTGVNPVDRLLAVKLFERVDDAHLRLLPFFDTEARGPCAAAGIDEAAMKRLWKALGKKAAQASVMEKLRRLHDQIGTLENWWAGDPSHFQLTSVGIALAHANLRRRGLQGYDLSTWIN